MKTKFPIILHTANRLLSNEQTINVNAMKTALKHKALILAVLFSAVFLQSLNAQTTWTSRNSAENNEWRSVTYGNGVFVAVAYNGTNRVMTSPDGVNWTARTAAAQEEWNSVTFGGGTFVAVGESGTHRVMTSPDGITWTRRTAPAHWWRSVTYGNGTFVAVSDNGEGNRVMTSTDGGITWTSRTSAKDYWWNAVTYGNNLFVAVAGNGGGDGVMTSPNGINWTIRNSAVDNVWKAVTFGNGRFVAVAESGSGNRAMSSTDGINWVAGTNTPDLWWKAVSYGNGTFVAVADNGSGNRVMTSIDGITWTARTSARDYWWNAVTFANGLFVAVAGNGSGAMTSGNLITPPSLSTTTQSSVTATTAILGGNIAADGGAAVTERGIVWATTANPTTSNNKVQIGSGVGSFSQIVSDLPFGTLVYVRAYATNSVGTAYGNQISFTTLPPCPSGGVNWTGRTTYMTLPWQSVTYGNGMFLAAEQYYVMSSSNGGSNWTINNFTAAAYWRLAYGGNTFVAVTQNAIRTSTNGSSWITRTLPVDNYWEYVTYGNGTFVAVAVTGSGNRVMTSSDEGVTWIVRSSAADNSWGSVTYGNGMFVAVSSTGGQRVMTSPDGISWTARSASANNSWRSVTYGNGIFVAVSSDGGQRVMTSSNGINWTARNASANNYWRSVTYGNGIFVAVSSNGEQRVMTSPDGINWTSHNSSAEHDWVSVAYGNGMFAAVSQTRSNNSVMTSPAVEAIQGAIQTETEVGSFVWQGSTYTANGTYKKTFNTAAGCDSIATLNLTIINLPSLSTDTEAGITATSAILGGNISNDGDDSVTERGIVWATTTSPTISNAKIKIGSGTGEFSQTIDALPFGTLIYARAYATNAAGTAYGNEISFITLTPSLATLSTAAATNVSAISATVGGTITADGGVPITERGIVWSDLHTQNPTIANNKVPIGSGTGSFSQTLSGLSPGNTIYVRAYAINAAGVAYGNQISFRTEVIWVPPPPPPPPPPTLATLSTHTAANIYATSATLGGNVTAEGGTSVTERGIAWATTANPTVANNKVDIGSGTGSFSEAVSGLPVNTLIYVRAYAINSAGTAYGDEISFTTLYTLPVTLISFTAKADGNHTKLQWQTANESNNKGFEIWRAERPETKDQRPEDVVFVKIGEIPATSHAVRHTLYAFTDKQPSNGNNYYKLVQVDNDGTATELGVRTLTFNFQPLTLHLYPNPVKTEFTFTVQQVGEILKIYNVQGQLLLQKPITQQVHKIDVSGFATGTYIYRYGGYQGKFVKE